MTAAEVEERKRQLMEADTAPPTRTVAINIINPRYPLPDTTPGNPAGSPRLTVTVLQWCGSVLLLVSTLVNINETLSLAGSVVAFICGAILLPPVWRRLPLPMWLALLVLVIGMSARRYTMPAKQPRPLIVGQPLPPAR